MPRQRKYILVPGQLHPSVAAANARKKAIIEAAKDVPCADCGKRFPPCVMDFDHRDHIIKRYNIGSECPPNRLIEEISKCDVVCANCHRIRTYLITPDKRRGRPKGVTNQSRLAPMVALDVRQVKF